MAPVPRLRVVQVVHTAVRVPAAVPDPVALIPEAATEEAVVAEVDSLPAEVADPPVAEAAEADADKKASRITTNARCFSLVCCQHVLGVKQFVQLLFTQQPML